MIQSLYIQKSFALLGRSLPNCLGCKFCRLGDDSTAGMDLDVLPGEINPLFKRLPVAVNLLFGDPTLQPEHTDHLFQRLEKNGHTGPVVVILKGNFSRLPNHDYDLDLHFAFSTFGIDHELDGGSREQFMENLQEAKRRKHTKFSIEFRPIIYGVNDSPETIAWVLDLAREYKIPVGYSGLQGKPTVVDEWRKQDLLKVLKPVPGYRFGHKKVVAEDVEATIHKMARQRGVNVFRKTSCLVSYTHGLERDYNAHYYRPSEVGCDGCPMRAKCESFKASLNEESAHMLPYEHEVVDKTNHECILKRNGICEYPSDDCSRISGKIIKTDVKLTTADVRVSKWLTGLTVDADFVESPFLSDFWRTTAKSNLPKEILL